MSARSKMQRWGLPIMAAALPAAVASTTLHAATPALGGVHGVEGAEAEQGARVRSALVVPAMRPLGNPIESDIPPRGLLRLWLGEHSDRRVPIGANGQLHVTSTTPGYVMLWSMDRAGRVYPIADGMTAGRSIVRVGPDVVRIPENPSHTITICPPAGQSAWFALHSDTLIPEQARQRLQRELSGARIDAADGAARFAAIVRSVVSSVPDWQARSETLFYDVVPGGVADRNCPPVEAFAPSPAPAPRPAPAPLPAPPTPRPTFAELEKGPFNIQVTLDRVAYYAQEPIRIHVRSPMPCPSLTVLALGAGGAVDVLLPNAQSGRQRMPAAGETVILPRPGSGITFVVRPPPAGGVQERVVALCNARSDRPLHEWRNGDGATTLLQQNDLRYGVLWNSIDTARPALVIGMATYTNLGAR